MGEPTDKTMAEEAVKLARQIWKEVVLGTGDVLPEPGGSARDRQEGVGREGGGACERLQGQAR